MISRTLNWFRKKGHRLPKSLTSLTSPKLKRSWHNLDGLSRAEKKEILSGSWRDATPVQLVSDSDDRDRGGFVEPLSFLSDEAAAGFLEQETQDDNLEHRIPTLQLAQQFFENLASTANEEIDVEDASHALWSSEADLKNSEAKSDTIRREEQLDVHREFFTDYYIQQSLISETERKAFLDAMLSPATALFQVNPEHPLTRLVLRDQIESHVECAADRVFQRTCDPLVYSLPITDSQINREVPKTALPADTSDSEQKNKPLRLLENPYAISSSDTVALSGASLPAEKDENEQVECSAQERSGFGVYGFCMDALMGQNKMEQKDCVQPTHSAASLSPAPSPFRSPQPTQLASLAHFHWLQRHVATGSLTTIDILTLILSCLAVRLAQSAGGSSPLTRKDGCGSPQIIFDLFGARAVPAPANAGLPLTKSAYYRDVASYARSAAMQLQYGNRTADVLKVPELDELDKNMDQVLLEWVVVVAALSSQGRGRKRQGGQENPRQATATLEDDLVTKSSHQTPLSERAPNLAFIAPADGCRILPCMQLFHNCNVVLFTPFTTQDGRRPLLVFGEDVLQDRILHAAPNRFVDLCKCVNSNFNHLQRQLKVALEYVKVGGYLLYATQSMNPLENEAVVCAVLSSLKRASSGSSSEADTGDTLGLCVECVPLNAEVVLDAVPVDERDALMRWLSLGHPGVSSWVALEGAPPQQELAWCDPAIVAEVSTAAWRSNPLHTGFDAGFVILLKVRERRAQVSLPVALPRIGTGVRREPYVRSCAGAQVHEKNVRALESWQQAPSPEIFAVTPSLREWCTHFTALEREDSSPMRVTSSSLEFSGALQTWKLITAGVPIGYQVAPRHKDEKSDVELSSAASWNEEIVAWIGQGDGWGDGTSIPRCYSLRITLPMFCELLRLGRLNGDEMAYWIIERQRQQRSQDPQVEANELAKEEEINAFLRSIKDLLYTIDNGEHVKAKASRTEAKHHHFLNVLLSPALPYHTALEASEAECALHEAVLQELAAVGVVATLVLSRRVPRQAATLDGDTEDLTFSLKLHVPDAIHDRDLHFEAIREMSVGLRDAFLYVLRRMQYPYTITLSPGARQGREMVNSATVPLEIVKLKEDEYEELAHSSSDTLIPDSVKCMLSTREVQRRERRLRSLSRKLNHGGIHVNGTKRNDWVKTLSYDSRRRSSS